MTKARDALLAKLEELRADPAANLPQLQQVLQCKFADLVAQGARLVAKHNLKTLTPLLVEQFEHFLEKPSADPYCLAKSAIADALYRFTYSDENLFLQGIRHIQMEPVYGGSVDSAAELRGLCALGLVRMNYPQVLLELGDLLADSESPARIAAARAIAYSENLQGVPLLRLRALMGDQPEVLAECLTALLKLDPQQSLTFVLTFLRHPEPQVQELVALALGEARLEAAFAALKEWWQRTRVESLRSTGALAIAMLRSDTALEFLLSVVATGSQPDASHAIAALALYRQDERLWAQLSQVIEDRNDEVLMTQLSKV